MFETRIFSWFKLQSYHKEHLWQILVGYKSSTMSEVVQTLVEIKSSRLPDSNETKYLFPQTQELIKP